VLQAKVRPEALALQLQELFQKGCFLPAEAWEAVVQAMPVVRLERPRALPVPLVVTLPESNTARLPREAAGIRALTLSSKPGSFQATIPFRRWPFNDGFIHYSLTALHYN
jgi:hypothetical protein